jgi:hypothetical protein
MVKCMKNSISQHSLVPGPFLSPALTAGLWEQSAARRQHSIFSPLPLAPARMEKMDKVALQLTLSGRTCSQIVSLLETH